MNGAQTFMHLDQDTIVAISTPPGRGGIGIVRLSGPQAREIAEPLVRLRSGLEDRRARFGQVLDADGAVLDEAVVTLFAGPNSYTAEDVVEIAAHGSPVLLDWLVRAAIAGGARLAEPGEFTQRAFLAGRLDLTQAEAVDDLISAGTLHQARVAAAQLGGSLARLLAEPKANLLALIAELEAGVDFAEDDLELMGEDAILAALTAIREPLARLAATYSYGRIVREGFTLALVGAPNAGKSSLFNALLERERSIVTAEPGTTRDSISEQVAIHGIPVRLVDTAGLRLAPGGTAEAMGIARAREALAEADLVLVVLDGSDELPEGIEGRAHLVVWSKQDLRAEAAPSGVIGTSAKTGEGLGALREAIGSALAKPVGEAGMVTNLRQHQALVACLEGLAKAEVAVKSLIPQEMLLLDLYGALAALDSLTGATSQEEILGMIFGRFCIGK